MNCPLISVIVPVYKVEEYLTECVKSITEQDYRNLEIILVDDGSPDRCPEICDQFAKEDTRIKVIHKQNGGLSDARNAGIKASSGEYILFIDSDDYWIDNHSITRLVECLNRNPGTEIIFFGRTTYCGNNIYVANSPLPNSINGKEKLQALTALLRESDFISSACQKLIQTSLIKDNNVFFEKGMLSEDVDWSIRLYLSAHKFGSVYAPFYGYRKREGSITQSFNPRHASDIYKILTKWDSLLTDAPEHKPFRGYLAYIYSCALGSIGLLTSKNRHEYYGKFRKLVHLLDYVANPKARKVRKLYKFLGYRLTSFTLTAFLKYRPKRIK